MTVPARTRPPSLLPCPGPQGAGIAHVQAGPRALCFTADWEPPGRCFRDNISGVCVAPVSTHAVAVPGWATSPSPERRQMEGPRPAMLGADSARAASTAQGRCQPPCDGSREPTEPSAPCWWTQGRLRWRRVPAPALQSREMATTAPKEREGRPQTDGWELPPSFVQEESAHVGPAAHTDGARPEATALAATSFSELLTTTRMEAERGFAQSAHGHH